jgi:flavorubredoxin
VPTTEIKKDIHWVGAVDWDVRDFHGYSTEKGTSYNAFLALDEKVTLFDTVKKPFRSEFFHNLRSLTPLEKIDYVVVNHVEMDHTGCLPELLEAARPEKLFCSPMGKKALLQHFHRDDWPFEVVKSGDTLSLGRKTVQFLETRMLHWPDSMFSYIPEERLLLSSDAFGQHWASSERFNDQVDAKELMLHAAKYYANILLLYSPFVQKLLAEVGAMNLDIDMIAPDHGLIWRSRPGEILEAYDRWSRQETVPKALVIYDSMWHSTESMARAIFSGILQTGVQGKLMDLKVNHRSDIVTETLDARALLFGSSTLNNNMLPRMADILTYMKGLKPTDKISAAFGSFGWSGEAVKQINTFLEEMKFQIADPGIKIRYVPTHEDLKACADLGTRIGNAVKGGG